MKGLKPSTRGQLSIVLTREHGLISVPPQTLVKYASVREIVNAAIAGFDHEANPVISVAVSYTFPEEDR